MFSAGLLDLLAGLFHGFVDILAGLLHCLVELLSGTLRRTFLFLATGDRGKERAHDQSRPDV